MFSNLHKLWRNFRGPRPLITRAEAREIARRAFVEGDFIREGEIYSYKEIEVIRRKHYYSVFLNPSFENETMQELPGSPHNGGCQIDHQTGKVIRLFGYGYPDPDFFDDSNLPNNEAENKK